MKRFITALLLMLFIPIPFVYAGDWQVVDIETLEEFSIDAGELIEQFQTIEVHTDDTDELRYMQIRYIYGDENNTQFEVFDPQVQGYRIFEFKDIE